MLSQDYIKQFKNTLKELLKKVKKENKIRKNKQ